MAPEKYGDHDYYTSGANKIGVQSTMQVWNAKSKITMQWKMIVTFDTNSVKPIISDATRSHNYSRKHYASKSTSEWAFSGPIGVI